MYQLFVRNVAIPFQACTKFHHDLMLISHEPILVEHELIMRLCEAIYTYQQYTFAVLANSCPSFMVCGNFFPWVSGKRNMLKPARIARIPKRTIDEHGKTSSYKIKDTRYAKNIFVQDCTRWIAFIFFFRGSCNGYHILYLFKIKAIIRWSSTSKTRYYYVTI